MEQKERKLSQKENAFVDFYLSNGFNGTQACISAGYSPKTAQEQASRLLSKVIIQNAIKLRQKPLIEKFKITRESLIADLEMIKKACLEEDLKNGKFAQYNSALKAIEQTARMLGLNEPEKVELSGQVDVRVQKLKRMNENDLKKEMIEL